MALKRKRPADQLESDEPLSPERISDSSGEDLAAFATYNGTSGDKKDWDLDAFAPYKPTETKVADRTLSLKTEDLVGTPINEGDASAAEEDARGRISLDSGVELNSFEEAGFGIGLSGLHAAPVDNPEEAEARAAKVRKPNLREVKQKPEEIFEESFSTDWSKYAAPLPPPLDPVFEEPIEPAPMAVAPVIPEASPIEFGEPGRLFVRLGKFTATYDVDAPSLTIGRPDPDREYTPEVTIEWDDAISRKHARVFRTGNDDYIEDLGSTNGTKVNGVLLPPHSPQLLANGDLIHIGSKTEIGYYK